MTKSERHRGHRIQCRQQRAKQTAKHLWKGTCSLFGPRIALQNDSRDSGAKVQKPDIQAVIGCISVRLPWYARIGESESKSALQHSDPASSSLPALNRAILRVTHTRQPLVAIKVTPTIHHLGNSSLGAVGLVRFLTYEFGH